MKVTLSEISSLVGGRVFGDQNLLVTGIKGFIRQKEGDLTFLDDKKFEGFLSKTQASAVIMSEGKILFGRSGHLC